MAHLTRTPASLQWIYLWPVDSSVFLWLWLPSDLLSESAPPSCFHSLCPGWTLVWSWSIWDCSWSFVCFLQVRTLCLKTKSSEAAWAENLREIHVTHHMRSPWWVWTLLIEWLWWGWEQTAWRLELERNHPRTLLTVAQPWPRCKLE